MKTKTVVVVLPEEDWDLFQETLTLDSKSAAFDKDLRSAISKALERVDVSPVGARDRNAVQFPRLLAEIYAAGLTVEQERELCTSMEITRQDLYDLLERADAEFERLKKGLDA